MAETIEIGYKPVGGNNLGIYHKYILYTDSAGQQFFIGIYPENYTFSEYVLAGGSFGKMDYNRLSDVYDNESRDWDPSRANDPESNATPRHRETIKTSDGMRSVVKQRVQGVKPRAAFHRIVL